MCTEGRARRQGLKTKPQAGSRGRHLSEASSVCCSLSPKDLFPVALGHSFILRGNMAFIAQGVDVLDPEGNQSFLCDPLVGHRLPSLCPLPYPVAAATPRLRIAEGTGSPTRLLFITRDRMSLSFSGRDKLTRSVCGYLLRRGVKRATHHAGYLQLTYTLESFCFFSLNKERESCKPA